MKASLKVWAVTKDPLWDKGALYTYENGVKSSFLWACEGAWPRGRDAVFMKEKMWSGRNHPALPARSATNNGNIYPTRWILGIKSYLVVWKKSVARLCCHADPPIQYVQKSSEDFQPTPISDYAPLEVGKYVVYNLILRSSLISVRQRPYTCYQVKYQVDAAITDNLGRPCLRIFRYIRNTPTAAWTPDNSFTSL